MTELTFLIDLLLNHDLTKPTKDAIAMRIKDVEEQLTTHPQTKFGPIPAVVQKQAPSTLALMAKHGDIPDIPKVEMPPVVPVEQIAQTPATQAALAARNQMINGAISGQIDQINTGKNIRGPKKW